MLAVLLLAASAGLRAAHHAGACADLHGAPLESAPDLSSCEAFRGQCDATFLSTLEKAALLLHCPATCGGTKYTDGGGVGYCPYVEGHDSCFDEPPDCATRKPTTAVGMAMCRKTLGLCSGRGRRADTCGEGYGEVNDLMAQSIEARGALASLVGSVPGLQASHMPRDPVLLRQAAEALK